MTDKQAYPTGNFKRIYIRIHLAIRLPALSFYKVTVDEAKVTS